MREQAMREYCFLYKFLMMLKQRLMAISLYLILDSRFLQKKVKKKTSDATENFSTSNRFCTMGIFQHLMLMNIWLYVQKQSLNKKKITWKTSLNSICIHNVLFMQMVSRFLLFGIFRCKTPFKTVFHITPPFFEILI